MARRQPQPNTDAIRRGLPFRPAAEYCARNNSFQEPRTEQHHRSCLAGSTCGGEERWILYKGKLFRWGSRPEPTLRYSALKPCMKKARDPLAAEYSSTSANGTHDMSHIAVRSVEHPLPRPTSDVLELEARRCVEPPPGIGVGVGKDHHLHRERGQTNHRYLRYQS